MVYGNIEESLNLVSVQVHRDNAVYTGTTQQVGHQFGANAHTWLVLAVLTCPAEVGDHGVDVAGRCALGGIDHQEQLHQVVRIGEGALYQEHITATDGLLVRDRKLAIGKFGENQIAQRTIQTCADFLCKVSRACTREDQKRVFLTHYC